MSAKNEKIKQTMRETQARRKDPNLPCVSVEASI